VTGQGSGPSDTFGNGRIESTGGSALTSGNELAGASEPTGPTEPTKGRESSGNNVSRGGSGLKVAPTESDSPGVGEGRGVGVGAAVTAAAARVASEPGPVEAVDPGAEDVRSRALRVGAVESTRADALPGALFDPDPPNSGGPDHGNGRATRPIRVSTAMLSATAVTSIGKMSLRRIRNQTRQSRPRGRAVESGDENCEFCTTSCQSHCSFGAPTVAGMPTERGG